MNRIPTKDALIRRGISVGDGLCSLCGSEEESVTHLFTSCVVATVLWQKVSGWCHIPNIFAFSFRDLVEIHSHSRLGAAKKIVVQGILVTACWCLWKARNNAVFSAGQVKVEDIFSEVKALSFFWFKHRSKFKNIIWNDWCRFVIM
ncbi:uncharacterized protein LOC143600047 [Bidens hawaiensis]|uniref:uncharacterized protein LOC143600047 n=1 Tax=Bidens hawaiensis TaxID=980011 RepID=UPI0040490E76